ncbi:hypothetical protein D3C75_958810 [compost metagenome]
MSNMLHATCDFFHGYSDFSSAYHLFGSPLCSMIRVLCNPLTGLGRCLGMPRYTFSGVKQGIRALANTRHDLPGIRDQVFELGSELANFVFASKLHVDGEVPFSNFGNELFQLHQWPCQITCENIHQQYTEQYNRQRCPNHRDPVARHEFIDSGRVQIRAYNT